MSLAVGSIQALLRMAPAPAPQHWFSLYDKLTMQYLSCNLTDSCMKYCTIIAGK